MSVGLLEGLTSVIGDEDTDIGGLYITRLTAAVAQGATTLPVETTFGWPTSGRLSVEGIVYTYSGTTSSSFTGIQHNSNGVLVAGTFKLHRDLAEVVDLNRSRNALDRVRRAMLVEYAEAEDLNALARNLGVLRLPFLNDDERFRKIVKALSYNPRGTTYGLELALDGLVDAGNYEIFEDLLNFPCTVFISLSGAAVADDVSAGKSFLNAGVHRLPTTPTTVTVPASPPILKVQSVRFKDENFITDCRTAKPSAQVIEEYIGDPGTQLWAFNGVAPGTEAGHVTVNAGGWCDFIDPTPGATVGYSHTARIQQESRATLGITFAIDSTGFMSLSSANNWRVFMQDTARSLAFGCLGIDASTFSVGFTTMAGAYIAGAAAVLQKDRFYTIEIQKDGTKPVRLVVDGVVVQTLTHSSFDSTTARALDFGIRLTSTSGGKVRLKHVAAFITTLTDYWASRGAAGVLSTPNSLDTGDPASFITPADLGKSLRLIDTVTLNPEGGLAQGRYRIDGVISGQEVVLHGQPAKPGVQLDGSFPLRVVITGLGSGRAFRFPDDLGRKLVISGSTLGNNGTFTIDKILEPDTLVDMGSFLSPPPAYSNVCEVLAASFVTEAVGLSWKLDPNFAAETGVQWELSDAGSVSGSTLTLRQPLPLTAATDIVTVRYTDVYSGQVLTDPTVQNGPIDTVPNYEFYPFYVADPLGFARSYLDAITAAGVIPDFRVV